MALIESWQQALFGCVWMTTHVLAYEPDFSTRENSERLGLLFEQLSESHLSVVGVTSIQELLDMITWGTAGDAPCLSIALPFQIWSPDSQPFSSLQADFQHLGSRFHHEHRMTLGPACVALTHQLLMSLSHVDQLIFGGISKGRH